MMGGLQDDMEHPALDDLLLPIRDLQAEVRRKALTRLEYEGQSEAAIIAVRYNNKASDYAMEKYAYYVCFKCKKVKQHCQLL